jgi:hypothetical protein
MAEGRLNGGAEGQNGGRSAIKGRMSEVECPVPGIFLVLVLFLFLSGSEAVVDGKEPGVRRQPSSC